jgi:hypothetical protein
MNRVAKSRQEPLPVDTVWAGVCTPGSSRTRYSSWLAIFVLIEFSKAIVSPFVPAMQTSAIQSINSA